MNRAEVLECIRPVIDPEIGISIVDLGLIYDIHVDEAVKSITVQMTLTSPGCPMGPEIMSGVDQAVRAYSGFEDVQVALVWEPKWNPEEMASETAKDVLGIW